MSMASSRAVRPTATVGFLCLTVWLPFRVLPASASALSSAALPPKAGMSGNVLSALILALAVAFFFTGRALQLRLRSRSPDALFVAEAQRLAADGRARTVVTVDPVGFDRLPGEKRRGALESLRLYLSGFVGSGEVLAPLSRRGFGLILLFQDQSALCRRLQVLSQDVRFLYLAAYPGLGLGARLGAYPLDGTLGAADVLWRARTGYEPLDLEPPKPDKTDDGQTA